MRCRQRITTATTDAEQAQTLVIDAGKLADEVGHAVNVFDAIRRFIDAARLTTAGTLIRRIGSDGDVALFGQALGIQTGDLFFHATIGVCNDHGWVGLLRVIVSRGVYVGGDIQIVELVADRMDVDLARFVLADRAVVGEGERVLFVIGGQGFARREADQCRHERCFESVFHVKLLSNQKGGSCKSVWVSPAGFL
ncbi:hypothetical protein D3C77_346000 [compost metagenome]